MTQGRPSDVPPNLLPRALTPRATAHSAGPLIPDHAMISDADYDRLIEKHLSPREAILRHARLAEHAKLMAWIKRETTGWRRIVNLLCGRTEAAIRMEAYASFNFFLSTQPKP